MHETRLQDQLPDARQPRSNSRRSCVEDCYQSTLPDSWRYEIVGARTVGTPTESASRSETLRFAVIRKLTSRQQ